MTKQLTDALKEQKKSTQQKQLQISGTLGIPIGGQRLVEVPNRNSFVYVKLRDNQNEVIQAYNNQVAPSYGLPVIVEYKHNRYVVLGVDTIRYQNDWNSFASYLPRHGSTHSFDTSLGGGGDIVWVHGRQFMPSLITPSGTLGAPNVLMTGYALKNINGTWKYVGNTGTQNLTPYKPATGTQAVMALVYLDTVSGNPYFVVGSGSYFPESITGTAQIMSYVPSVPNLDHIPLAAIRMVTGTNTIGWNNIYDVRQYYYNITGVESTVAIQDEGVSLGSASTLNFVGTPVSVTLAGGTARVFITGSSGAGVSNLTGSSIGLPNKVALTNSSGFLTTEPSLAWGLVGTDGFLEFGANVVGKVFNAGYVGYQLYDNDFDIIGAGTGSGDRRVRIYDNLFVTSLAQSNALQVDGMATHWGYFNATGLAVSPINAPPQSNITGTDFILGVAGIAFQSVRMTVEDVAMYSFPASYIDGLNISYLTSGSLSVSPGNAYIPFSERLLVVPGTLSASFTPTATNNSGSWQHVYLYDSSGPTLEISTTLPASPYAGAARTKTGDTSRRYLGSVYCDAGGFLFKFTSAVHGNILKMNWLPTSPTIFPFRVLLGGASDTPVTLPITHLIPVVGAFNGLLAQLTVTLGASADLSAAIGDTLPPEVSSVNAGEINVRLNNANAGASATLFLPASEMKLTGSSLQYVTTQNAGSSTIGIRIKGVNIQR